MVYTIAMQPYRNDAGIFQLFNGDNKDRPTQVMQFLGKISFSVAFVATIAAGVFHAFLSIHRVLGTIVGVSGLVGLFLGLFMFIGVGARVMGQQAGVQSFPRQVGRVLARTFLFLLLPMMILTALLLLLFPPK